MSLLLRNKCEDRHKLELQVNFAVNAARIYTDFNRDF